jgi:hypothetical protein
MAHAVRATAGDYSPARRPTRRRSGHAAPPPRILVCDEGGCPRLIVHPRAKIALRQSAALLPSYVTLPALTSHQSVKRRAGFRYLHAGRRGQRERLGDPAVGRTLGLEGRHSPHHFVQKP